MGHLVFCGVSNTQLDVCGTGLKVNGWVGGENIESFRELVLGFKIMYGLFSLMGFVPGDRWVDESIVALM
jgi:hypothetical protein